MASGPARWPLPGGTRAERRTGLIQDMAERQVHMFKLRAASAAARHLATPRADHLLRHRGAATVSESTIRAPGTAKGCRYDDPINIAMAPPISTGCWTTDSRSQALTVWTTARQSTSLRWSLPHESGTHVSPQNPMNCSISVDLSKTASAPSRRHRLRISAVA